MNKVRELFGISTDATAPAVDWRKLATDQPCPFLKRKCIKVRKSSPDIAIGTCSVSYGPDDGVAIICPHRLLERRQIFTDALHLLTLHEPGNELHILPEITLPGGHVDYFIASVKNKKVKDFAGIELQTLDTTGTVWPERQRFLEKRGLPVKAADIDSDKSFGMNWKMTAKTILVQLHHKIQTFEAINKHLVLVVQDCLMSYMRREFKFDHLSNPARVGDPMHIHSYKIGPNDRNHHRIDLVSRDSTDTAGIAACLGLQASHKVELAEITKYLEAKITSETLFALESQ